VDNRGLRRVPHDAPSPRVIRAAANYQLGIQAIPSAAAKAAAPAIRTPPAPIYTL
jgi:hypothetical protein